jgi:hypothetical protein
MGLGALMLPVNNIDFFRESIEWPSLRLDTLPQSTQEILSLVPTTMIGADGILYLSNSRESSPGRIPLARTQWNRENSSRTHRLTKSVPWGIVLHWYGDKENFDKTVTGYLRGFDSLRQVEDYMTRTSAHFLIGDQQPSIELRDPQDPVGIIQTQKPDLDGTPFVASHISGLDYEAHKGKRQYFVRALYQLGYEESGIHSILQDWFDGGRVIDPNMRTIAIELTGYDFENPAHYPSQQQIANTISVIWGVMRRYGISANNLFGHHELQLNKADPGKKFMGLIRYLISAKALVDNDPFMNQLVFGNYLGEDQDTLTAVQKYIKFVYDHLLMVSKPNRVYEWEALSGYWFLADLVGYLRTPTPMVNMVRPPLTEEFSNQGKSFTLPANHEGIDLYSISDNKNSNNNANRPVNLVANGICQYVGEQSGCSGGKVAIFRHRQMNGGEILSVYGHLDQIYDFKVGESYPIRYPIGEIHQLHDHLDPFLHFAVAYGGTWKTDLNKRTTLPLNAQATWIRERYLDPWMILSGSDSSGYVGNYQVS